ncbi:Putative addiction module component [Nannocystis exedens]|uniref:Putative addiction module component n=1 Tax=Nannocystis exedens TaxID=54 RepID=A0A1I1VUW6_9BACT|nr:addiction module protein [Nannocystis exedens]PCC72877.1 putative addiction module component [Nannocystis exedens]SFD86876.1 Putative addiction module component [Nannocystis exedens]
MDPARVFDDLMALPPEIRRHVAERALATVDDPVSPEVEEAQYREVLRRLRAIEAGKEELVEWEVVQAELNPKIARHGT